jgi:Rab GDP dissociation inhibitor
VARYGNSPYIYPKWGLGGLPEGFSRRCAVHGGVYMLNTENKENFIQKIHYDDEGKVNGVQVGEETAKTTFVIGDPSYWAGTDKIKEVGKVARAICIMDHPIAGTSDSDSCQIIIPSEECDRKSDVYVCMSSYQHNIAADGHYIAVCSANVESDDSDPKKDLASAIALLGKVKHTFLWVSDFYEPTNDPSKDGCFITSSYDATTHFETCSREVLELYEQIMGEPLDLDTIDSDEIENND